ncbi:MGMT family protein [Paenibacillus kobensis]|uniref:MGMT family protein n=1 Tax=Paenibacillus kobensis TaxID=59841 RepID=UPI000FD906EA|nr:MGMT family protein [Paenibacillus kobensis]
MQPFTQRVIEIVKGIPEGSVMTYGQIAALAGSPKGARQVVRLLHSLSLSHGLPWHRIINAKGEVAIQDGEGHNTQVYLLRKEGVEVDPEGRVDLSKYRYCPDGLEADFY